MAKEKINIVLQGVNNTQKAFNDVKHKLSVLDRKTKTLQKGFATVAKASAVAFTAIGVAVGVSTAKIDKLVKTSQKLGIGVEFLQKFRFASKQVGIETNTADMALQRFSRRVAEARKGTGEAKDTLTQLGIALFDSSGKARDIEDVMFDVADAMANTKDASEQVRQAFKFFDSEGVALVALMKNGSDTMKDFFEDASNLGAVLSTEAAQGVGVFADQFTRLKTGISGVVDQFTAGLAPTLSQITTAFTEFVIQLNEDIEKMGFQNLGQFLATEFLGVLSTIVGVFQVLGNTIIDIANKVRDMGIDMGFIEESEAVTKIREELKKHTGLIEDQNRFKTKGAAFTKQMLHATSEEAKLLREQLATEIEKGRFQKLNFKNLLNFIDKAKEGINVPLSDDGDDGDDVVQEPRFVRTMRQAMENFNKETVESQMVKAFENGFKGAEDALVDFVQTGKLNFKDLVNSLIADLARIQIREKLLNPLMAMLPNLFGGNSNVDVESGMGGGFTGMGARAGGIDGKGGFPAILHPNETVIDHTKGQSRPAPNINFNIQATDASGFDQLLTARKNQIVSMVSQAMNQKGKAGLI